MALIALAKTGETTNVSAKLFFVELQFVDENKAFDRSPD